MVKFYVLPFLLPLLLWTTATTAQTTIKGTITDAQTKEPLAGASIRLVGAPGGASTDAKGNFLITPPQSATAMEANYPGYTSLVVILDGRTSFDIAMSEDVSLLDEVVVIGYGTVQRSDVTGAIESLKPKDTEVAQYDNFQDFLQGRMKGVYVQSNSSELLAPNTIRIRGANSLRGDNEPLYVIDGIIISSATEDAADPLTGGSSYLAPQSGLTGINPQDIASIEVLKDASATAIYGSRGANGVIIITTKRGKNEKPKVNYKLTTRMGKATRLIDVLDGGQYADMQNEFRASKGYAPLFYRYGDGSVARFFSDSTYMETHTDSIPRLQSVDWYKDVFKNSFTQSHYLSLTGGKEKSDYFFSGNFTNAKSYIPGVSLRQGDLLFSFNQQVSKRWQLSPRVSLSYIDNQASKSTENLGSSNASLSKQIVLAAPILAYSENNTLDEFDDIIDGPRAWLSDYDDDTRELRSLLSLKAECKINQIFTYRFLAGADYRTKKRQLWYGKSTYRGNLANGEAGITLYDRFRYNIDNTLLFDKKLSKKSKINGTVGMVMDATSVEQSTFSASNFANEQLRYNGISFGQVFQPLKYGKSREAILSFLGRTNYTYRDKYLLTVSFRTDGASKFASGQKFSFFPSGAFAWKMGEEKFLRRYDWISEAKWRIGYGRTGSQAISPYQTFGRFGSTANLLSNGQGGGVSAIIPQNLQNPQLIWETTDQFNTGFDFGFFNNRIEGGVDLYYKQTRDLLQELAIGPSSGFSTIITNNGSLINKGVEFELLYRLLNEGGFRWVISGNISMNRNKIHKLGIPPAQFGTQTYSAYIGRTVSGGNIFKVPANIFIEGQPAALFWGYATNGIIQSGEQLAGAPSVQGIAAQLGDVLYVDQNDDGNINEQDLTIIGNPNPDFTFGLGSQLTYKAFTLDFLFNGVQGNDIANANLAREDYMYGGAENIRTSTYEGAWRPGRTDATHPKLGYPIQGDFTDRMVEDGSFVRLTYVSLTYAMPVTKLKKISSASVFVSGQNLLLFTQYSGFDPEVNSFSFDPTRQGIDMNSFPNQKAVSIGLNVNF